MGEFRYAKDADGIVTITIDLDGPVNKWTPQFLEELEQTVARLEQDEIAGAILTSAKSTWVAGLDLEPVYAGDWTAEQLYHTAEYAKTLFRRVEKLGKPVVAAINGVAAGGGLETALACHHRIALDASHVQVGLPEVTIGVIPGAGGTTRLIHMLGAERIVPYLLQGKMLKPQAAKETGLIDDVAQTPDELMAKSRAWIKANPAPVKPWDQPGHKIPGGGLTRPHNVQLMYGATLQMFQRSHEAYRAPKQLLRVVEQVLTVDFESASQFESRVVANLMAGQECRNMVGAFFMDLQAIRSGASRPKDVPPSRLKNPNPGLGLSEVKRNFALDTANSEESCSRRSTGDEEGVVDEVEDAEIQGDESRIRVKKLGVLGGGMMGRAIAYVSSRAGMEVVLREVSMERAAAAVAWCQDLGQLVGEITPTTDVQDLKDCDLIIEAVFEDIELKHKVIAEVAAVLGPEAIFASNTSSLPITLLAEASQRPDRFVGIHFFSPAEKMPLIEIIKGKQTGDMAIATAFDYAQAVQKTPIVVNDSPGFFTTRVISAGGDEAVAMLAEGVHPVRIERLTRMAGFPIGPLALMDEVSQKLMLKIAHVMEKLGTAAFNIAHSIDMAQRLVEEFGRGGRAYGGGFYDYSAGSKKHIWPGLLELYYNPQYEISDEDIQDRFIYRQTVEAIKCMQEGVIESAADANIGSIFGIGFPPPTGGVVRYAETMGQAQFDSRLKELAERFGERFLPVAPEHPQKR